MGDGAVGRCRDLAARRRRLGADSIVSLGRHPDRFALAREFGAADVVSERGEEAAAHVRDLTRGEGAHSVLESVGTDAATDTAIAIARPGARWAGWGVPQDDTILLAQSMFFQNVVVGGGPAPTRGLHRRPVA